MTNIKNKNNKQEQVHVKTPIKFLKINIKITEAKIIKLRTRHKK
jgi:hypothetical protein